MKKLYIIGVLIVLIIILAVSYEQGRLDTYLPQSWVKGTPSNGTAGASGATDSFVGAYGRSPGMQQCLAFSDPGSRKPYFNRCTWV